MRTKRIQSRVTNGRFTLPLVALISVVCWTAASFLLPDLRQQAENGYSLWNAVCTPFLPTWAERPAGFVTYALLGYFLIVFNNAFTIIRIRASIQTSLYFLFVAACPALHFLYAGNAAALFFLISLLFLFKSYQTPRPVGLLFYSFLFLGAGSLLFPQLSYFVLLWFIGASGFRSLTFRSFWGSVIGWVLPYWFLLAHSLYHGEPELFYAPFLEMARFEPIALGRNIPLWKMITPGYLFVLFFVSAIHCFTHRYEDKIRTRAYLDFLIVMNIFIFLFMVLQPHHDTNLLPLLLIGISLLTGHFFMQTGSRLSNLFFIVSMTGLLLLYVFNVWTLL